MHRLMLFTALFAVGCSPSPLTPVARAAWDDDADAVRACLRNGVRADDREARGLTPLMWAARAESLRAMTALLDAGADINAGDGRGGWTPLLHAIHTRNPKAVALLLARGADPNATTPGGLTTLMMAADDPEPDIVAALLEHGADSNAVAPSGVTALSQAVSGGAFTDITDRPLLGGCHPETVRALITHDPAARLAKNDAGRSAIWWARFHGCDAVLNLIGESRTVETPRDGLQPTPATVDRSRR